MTEFEQPSVSFEAPADDPVAVYLASGLTSLEGDRLKVVELVSSVVRELCSNAHPLGLSAGPLVGRHHRARRLPFIRSRQGIVWAERLRIPVLVLLHEKAEISRLIRFGPRKGLLEAHGRQRASRALRVV